MPPPVQKYEYTVVTYHTQSDDDFSGCTTLLNQWGADGWHSVGVCWDGVGVKYPNRAIFIFERPL